MVQLQVLSKVIMTGDNSIIETNSLDESYFVGYEEEYKFIAEHLKRYGNVPDKATFLAKFPKFELLEVTESDNYLVDTIREENLFQRAVPIVQKMADILKTDANAATEYMLNAIKTLQPNYNLGTENIIKNAIERYNQFEDRLNNQDQWFLTTGFEELDEICHGLSRGEEFCVLYARTNMGKSWVMEYICKHIWQIGFNAGYFSPEMSANSIGYRFDTLYKHFSNKGLMWGKNDIDKHEYKAYIDELSKNEVGLYVSIPKHFDNKVTVSKLRQWVIKYDLKALFIDGITYLSDERYKRGDTKTTSLTNISEDLMSLSIEMKIPVVVVVQANRTGVVEKDKDGTPELESIRDSDGISHNASKVLAIRQKDGILEIGVKKQRFGAVGGKLHYQWDIDTGTFVFVPSYDDAEPETVTQDKVVDIKSRFKDKTDMF